jgi:hypothetical protein
MKLKSEMVSNILKIMLWALVTLTTLTLLANIIYVIDSTFYMDFIYSSNTFIDSVSTILYFIIMVIYLIWIYRVHMDLKLSFPDYPRSPGAALACSMIPFYSFYGLPSTYRMIGQHFQHETTGVEKLGRWISGLAFPLIICFVVLNVLNRLVARADGDPNTALWLTSNAVELTTHIVFLSLCILVSKGLQQINLDKEARNAFDNQPEWTAYVR